MRRVLVGSVALLALVGCSLVVRPEPVPEPVAAGEEVTAVSVSSIDSARVPKDVSPYWDRVRAGAALKIGINERYPPFGVTTDPAKAPPGEALVGFDVDLARHLGQTLGVPVELVGVRTRDVMAKLNDGTIDLAMAGITRTVFRAAQINFSGPYLNVSQAALVERRLVDGSRGTDEERRRDTLESYDDLRKLPGIRIGAVKWTRPHRLALTNFPNARVEGYDTIQEASRALILGEVNALVHDDPYVRVWSSFHPKQAGRFSALLEPVTEEPICIGMRKGDLEFLRFLDAYAAEVRNDGTVERIYRKQFVEGAWLQTAEGEDSP